MAEGPHTLQCLEVWGGNEAVDRGVNMSGLDAWIYSRPHHDDAGGGDVHFVSSCASGRVIRLLLADVAGHGSHVAPIAQALRAIMRRHVNRTRQTEVVDALNKEFSRLAESGQFATAIIATYWTPTDSLILCNAGHPRPLWYSAADGKWSTLACGPSDGGRIANIPLGILGLAEYDQFGCNLGRGDMVLLYSDSLVESRDPAGALLGEPGLLQLLAGLDGGNPTGFIPSLLAALEERSHAMPEDDLTIMLIRPNAQKPRFTFSERLALIGRTGKVFVRSFLPGGKEIAMPEPTLANLAGPFFPRLNRRYAVQTPSVAGDPPSH